MEQEKKPRKPRSDKQADNSRKIIDTDINKRFLFFRKTYVHENQLEAAKAMGVSQPNLSVVESFGRPVPSNYYRILADKYMLNENWLRRGEGTPRQEGVPEGNNRTTLVHLMVEVKNLERKINVLQANQDLLINFTERLLKDIQSQGYKVPDGPKVNKV